MSLGGGAIISALGFLAMIYHVDRFFHNASRQSIFTSLNLFENKQISFKPLSISILLEVCPRTLATRKRCLK
jgi:hypothetical protein